MPRSAQHRRCNYRNLPPRRRRQGWSSCHHRIDAIQRRLEIYNLACTYSRLPRSRTETPHFRNESGQRVRHLCQVLNTVPKIVVVDRNSRAKVVEILNFRFTFQITYDELFHGNTDFQQMRLARSIDFERLAHVFHKFQHMSLLSLPPALGCNSP